MLATHLHRHDLVGEPASALGLDGALMGTESQFVLLSRGGATSWGEPWGLGRLETVLGLIGRLDALVMPAQLAPRQERANRFYEAPARPSG